VVAWPDRQKDHVHAGPRGTQSVPFEADDAEAEAFLRRAEKRITEVSMRVIAEFENREVRFRLIPECKADKRLVGKMGYLKQFKVDVEQGYPYTDEEIKSVVLTAQPESNTVED
jgi:hypothetical protein